MTDHSGSVVSPTCAQLCVGLVAPFVSPRAQEEIESAWGLSAREMFEWAKEATDILRSSEVLHAALGVWSRMSLPAEAVQTLGGLLADLPTADPEAQALLDDWTSRYTNQMIDRAPITVKPDTDLVLGSALAMEDVWRDGPGVERVIGWKGGRTEGFALAIPKTSALMSKDGSAVIAWMPLASGATLMLAMSQDMEPEDLLADLPKVYVPLHPTSPLVRESALLRPESVEVEVPTFTERSTVDLREDPARWGLSHALEEGVPGLGERTTITDAKQSSFIEVSRTGVRAAAVTMASLTRSAVMPRYDGLSVTFDRPFAFLLGDAGFDHSLFEGVHR